MTSEYDYFKPWKMISTDFFGILRALIAVYSHSKAFVIMNISQNCTCNEIQRLSFLNKNRQKLGWPASQTDVALSAEELLKLDYDFLVTKGRQLQMQCDKALKKFVCSSQPSFALAFEQHPSVDLMLPGLISVYTAVLGIGESPIIFSMNTLTQLLRLKKIAPIA